MDPKIAELTKKIRDAAKEQTPVQTPAWKLFPNGFGDVWGNLERSTERFPSKDPFSR